MPNFVNKISLVKFATRPIAVMKKIARKNKPTVLRNLFIGIYFFKVNKAPVAKAPMMPLMTMDA